MEEVVVSDVYHQIKEEIQRLQAVVAALTQERDELVYYTCPELAARYAREIGDYQNRINYQKIMILEIKRRIEIAQAALNREKTVTWEAVDEQIHTEYQDFHEKINQQFEEAEEAKRQQREREYQRREYEQRWQESYGEEDFQEDCKEDFQEDSQSQGRQERPIEPPSARDLYRKIIKKLHPDVNPNATEREKELFRKATEAYEKGDIAALQDIYNEIFEHAAAETDREFTYDELLTLRERLTARICSLRAEIGKIRSEFPYNQKILLDDPEELRTKQKEFAKRIHQYEKEIERLMAILERVNQEMEDLRRKKQARPE